MFTTVAALLLAALLTVPALADEPAAIVEGDEITREEVQAEAQLNQIVFSLYQQHSRFAQTLLTTEEGEEFLERYERDVLDDMIDTILMEQEAEQMDITADEEDVQAEVDRTIDNIKQQNQMSEDELEAALAQQGRTIEDFREEIAVDVREMMVEETLREEVVGEVTITDEEVEEFYDENPEQFRDEEGELVPLEEVREAIEQELSNRKQEEAWQEWLSGLREEADVTINL